MKEEIKIAVVDDHSLLRGKICEFIEDLGFTLVWQAENGREALDRMGDAEALPEICLLDVNMPVMNGFETAKAIRKQFPTVKILAISIDTADTVAANMVKAGATGFLCKNADPMKYRDAVIKMNDKGYYFDSEGMNALFSYIRR